MKFNYALVFITVCFVASCAQKPQKMKTTSEEKPLHTVLNEPKSLQNELIKMHQDGMDFYAAGEHDAWTLTMDFENEIHFKTKNDIDYTAAAVVPVLAQDHNVKRFRTTTKQGELIVQIVQIDCIDAVTQLKSKYQVHINYKAASANDYSDFKGCGMFIPDYRLHDIWAIVAVDGFKIDANTFGKNKPIIEINIANEHIMGADGCNTFRGRVYNEADQLYLSPLASTRMACINNKEITRKINEILSERKLQYKIQNNELQLFTNNKKRITLQHID